MNILLLNPYCKDTRYNKEPIGLLYLASALAEDNHSVHFIDMSFPQAQKDLYRTLFNANIGLVGITVCSDAIIDCLNYASLIKRLSPKTSVIFGGPHATYEYESVLSENMQVDFICVGEGEHAIRKLAHYLDLQDKAHDDLNSIPNIAYRSGGTVIKNENMYVDINTLNLPSRYDIWENSSMEGEDSQFTYSINTSRGCAYNCSFCALNTNVDKKWKCRNVDSVQREIDLLISKYQINELCINDADFFTSFKHAEEITALLQNYPEIKKVYISCRVNTLNKAHQLLPLLSANRSLYIEIGMESYSQSQLLRYNKKIVQGEIERMHDIIDGLKYKNDIQFCFDLIPFDPFVTPEELSETIAFLIDHNYFSVKNEKALFSCMSLLPDTAFKQLTISSNLALENKYLLPFWKFVNINSAYIYSYMLVYRSELLPLVNNLRTKVAKRLTEIGNDSISNKIECAKLTKRLTLISFSFFQELTDAAMKGNDLLFIYKKFDAELASIMNFIDS